MNNVKDEINKNACCGCGGCAEVCPKNAITMQFDEQGFLYPAVNEKLCVNCGLCVNVCKTEIKHEFAKEAYAAKNTDNEVLKKSSSGGIAWALCKYFINAGGTVYGVAYDEKHAVITQRAETLEECEKFCGSKYVQTNPKNTLAEIKKDLAAGRYVLYFGTPCHVRGVLAAMKNADTERLLTVDLICHGVPSPKLFGEYINFLNKNKKFKSFAFRTKNTQWGNGSKSFATTIYYNNGKKETDTVKSRAFLRMFFSNNCLRPSCYNCKYIGKNKPADITIADYWGLKDEHPDFFDTRGVSAVMIHTDKGKEIFTGLTDVEKIPSTVDKICKKQGNMHRSSSKPDSYECFWKEYNKKGFMFVLKKYGGYSVSIRIKTIIKKMIRR